SSQLAITDNASGSPQQVSVSGTGTAPGVQLSPISLNFGHQAVNTTGAPQTVTLTNSGSSALTISSISITGTNSGDFAQTNNCTGPDSAGQTWTQTSSGYENESSAGPRSGMFYVANSAAVTSVRARYTTSGGVIKPGIMVMEISGAAISAVADGSVNNASGASVHVSPSGRLTTTHAHDILIFA